MAAELIGSVNKIPIITETKIPIIKGCCSIANIIIVPSQVINSEIGGPISNPIVEPIPILTSGVTIISILVLPEIRCPTSIPTNAAIKAPKGSPGPASVITPVSLIILPVNILVANPPIIPDTAAEITISGVSLNL